MIGKLLKNDFKAGLRSMGNIYLAALIACGAMVISAFFKSGFVSFLTSAAVIVIAFVAVIVTYASVVFGANKSLFGREGYLTQTLPVRTTSLIFSKWFTASVWVLISYCFVLLAGFGVVFYWTVQNSEGAELYDMIYSFAQGFGLADSKVVIKALIVQSVIGLFNACILVMFIFFSITLSNVRPFNRFGTFGVIIYLALTLFVVQGATWGLEALCDISLVITNTGEMMMTIDPGAVDRVMYDGGMAVGFTGVYFKALVTVFLYIITVQLTENKINLK